MKWRIACLAGLLATTAGGGLVVADDAVWARTARAGETGLAGQGAEDPLSLMEAAFVAPGPPGGCATSALHAARGAWPTLDPDERAWVDRLAAPIPVGPPPGTRDTCFEPGAVGGFAGHELAATSAHFAIYTPSDGPEDVARAETTIELAEDALADFTARGWARPAGIDGYQMLVFVDPRPATLGGYSWVAPCEGADGGAMDWMVLNASWIDDPSRAGSLVAHELFHAVQRTYARDELVDGWDASENRWFVEAGAVYEEGLVFAGETGVAVARSRGWSARPWMALDTFDGAREYQAFVLPLAVEAALGDPSWHLALWQGVQGQVGWDVPGELDALAAGDGGWEALFRGYVARASEMDLPRGRALLGPREAADDGEAGALAGRATAQELPVSGVVDSAAPEAPQEGGASYVWIDTTEAVTGRALRLDATLDPEGTDGTLAGWAVEVVGVRSGGIVQRLSVTPDPTDPRTRVEVHGVAGALDGVWLIAAPTGPLGGGGVGWSWTARWVPGEETLSLVEEPVGCACSAGASPGRVPIGALLAASLLTGRRRRRRTGPRSGATRPLALALLCLLLPAPAEAEVTWDHEWLHPRMFDYTHPDWGRFDPLAFFGYLTVSAETTLEHLPDGSLRFTWDAEILIADPRSVPALLELDSLSAARNTRIEEFEARFSARGEPVQVLDRRRLVERAAADHAMYFDGDTVLSLIAPRERPGTLRVHLQTLSEPHEGFQGYFGGVQFLQLNSPCARRVIRLRVPADEALRFETRSFDARPGVRLRKGVREYEFVFERMLPTFADAGMPPSLDAFPALLYSNQPDWESLGTIVRAAWEPHLGSTEGMDAWARALAAEAGDQPRKAARAIHDAVADGWGYLGFYPGESGWIPHAATACYDARLGDCKDRTALMVALMRAAGLDAAPVIIWSGERFATPKVPVIVANHAIVAVEPGDGGPTLFLDSVDAGIGAEKLRGSLSDRDALHLGPMPSLVRVPPAPRDHWLEEDEAFVSVQPDGSAEVFLVQQWHGQEAALRKEMDAGPDRVLWERALRERLAVTYPEAVVTRIVQTPHPADDQVWRLEVTLSSATFVERTGSLGVLSPPWLVRWARDVDVDDRRHPRVLQGSWFKSTVRIFLPRGVEVLRAPDPEVAAGGARLSSSLTVSSRTGELALALEVEARPGRLDGDDDPLLADFYGRVATWQDQSVVLRFPETAP